MTQPLVEEWVFALDDALFITYALRHYQTDSETQSSFLLAKLAAPNNVAPGINDTVATDLFRSIRPSVCVLSWLVRVDARLCVRGLRCCCCCCDCDGIQGLWPAQSVVSKFLLELC